MKTVLLDVRTVEEAAADLSRVSCGRRAQRDPRISFQTPELLWKVVSAKRWDVLEFPCDTVKVAFTLNTA